MPSNPMCAMYRCDDDVLVSDEGIRGRKKTATLAIACFILSQVFVPVSCCSKASEKSCNDLFPGD